MNDTQHTIFNIYNIISENFAIFSSFYSYFYYEYVKRSGKMLLQYISYGYGFHFQCCSIIIFREIQTSFKYYLHYIHMYYIEHTKLKGFFFLLVIRIYIFAVNVSLANENLENQFKIAKWKTETETKTEKKMKENVEWNCMYSSKK